MSHVSRALFLCLLRISQRNENTASFLEFGSVVQLIKYYGHNSIHRFRSSEIDRC